MIRPNSRCSPCNRTYIAANRKRWHELPAEEQRKQNIRNRIWMLVKHGKISRDPCEICGKKAEAHHDDYDQPLVVRWLCRKHHLAYHAIQDLIA